MEKQKIEKSIEIIKEADKRAKEAGTPLLINFSGGKDSSVLILLAKEADATFELIYMASGLELPGTLEFVKEQAARFDIKLHITDPVRDYYGDFPYWVRRFGYFPTFRYNYCSSRLKLRPSRKYLRGIYGKKHIYRVNGVRRSESPRRKKIYKNTDPIRPDWENAGHFLVEPILDWTGTDVQEYLKENNFEVQSLYNEFGVSGCAYCPYYQAEIYQRILNVYPNIYDDIIAVEDELGKASVAGMIRLHELRDDFFANREEIMAKLKDKPIENKRRWRE